MAKFMEIGDLAALKELLQSKVDDETYVHWLNEESRQYLRPGQHPQESYLRVQPINGKLTVAHYDCDGRSMIPSMKEMLEQLGTKPIDISAEERKQALFNPGGFAAMQPEFANQQERRDYAKNKLANLTKEQLLTMTATNFAKDKKYGGFFDRKPAAELPEVQNRFSAKPTKGR